MAYISGNPKTKKAAKKLVGQGRATCFEAAIGDIPWNGIVDLKGPQYPAAHTWYATGEVRDGKLVKLS